MRAANDNYDALSQSQPVTDRQRRYAEIVALGTHSHTRAAKMAGYAPASARLSAYHNDKNPAVQSIVDKHREEIAQRHSLSEDWVISNLIALARGADTSASRIRALELLGKHLGMFLDRKRVEHVSSFADELEALQPAIQEAIKNTGATGRTSKESSS